MSSLGRMLALLDLFTPEQPTLSAEEVGARSGLSRTTCYRYLAELTASGLLASRGGRYLLGHRIVRLDHQIRSSDPLIRAALGPMRELVHHSGGAVLLSSLESGDEILNLHCESADPAMEPIFGRGRVMPLFRSATSKVILAALPPSRVKRLLARHSDAPEIAGTGTAGLVKQLRTIRQVGYAVSQAEMPGGFVGLAAPVLRDAGQPPSALTLLLLPERFQLMDAQRLARTVQGHAEGIARALQRQD